MTSDSEVVCKQGAVQLYPATTNESPFILREDGIYFHNQCILEFNTNWFGRPITSHNDRVSVVCGMNRAYQLGYESAMKKYPKMVPL